MQSGFRPIGNSRLQIFRKCATTDALFYAPGYLAVVEDSLADKFEEALRGTGPSIWEAVVDLQQHAAAALRAWTDLRTRPYFPVCLTLYLNEQCNLNCVYCFASPGKRTNTTVPLSLNAVQSAARLVAENCQRASCPFTVVFHGGGEPALDLANMERLLTAIEETAWEYKFPIFRYIATGGAIPPENVRWLAKHFDLIGLSCDGPSEIQDRQRPLRNGMGSAALVERAAEIIHTEHKPLHIRTTITSDSVDRQEEIAEYICHFLHPQEIHVEPVYFGGRANDKPHLEPEQAEQFVAHFYNAKAVAQTYGIPWLSSGCRPGEIHGPYCNVFRDVLHLLPGDGATACFKMTNTDSACNVNLLIGDYDQATDEYRLDTFLVQKTQAVMSQSSSDCVTCFNQFHCSRLCPDHCLAEEKSPSSQARCQVQALLAERMLEETAQSWRRTRSRDNGVLSGKLAS
jgi:sulfatase maturation enzyme AslB (radical SAM superfamily)